MDRVSKLVGVLLVGVGLSGCGNLGKSNEERINDAIPPGSAVLASKQRLEVLLKSTTQNVADFEQEYQRRLSERANKCADGYQVSAFASNEKVREDLVGNGCFATVDDALGEWLGLQRLATLLKAPPLHPISASPAPFISGNGGIQQATFATKAGVVMLELRDKHQLVDMQSSTVLFQGEGRWSMGSLSPNGRLSVEVGDDNRTVVREAETGEVLASYAAKASTFHWLDEVGVIFAERVGSDENHRSEIVLLDLASGKRTPIPIGGARIEKVLAIPGKAGHYLLLTPGRMSEIALINGDKAGGVQLLSEQPSGLSGVGRNAVAVADGSYVFLAGGEMKQLRAASQEVRTLPLQPLIVDGVWATSVPDQLLIRTRLRGGAGTHRDFIYSIAEQALAPVDTAKLLSRRFIYIPSLNRNGIIDDSKIHVLDRIPTLAAQSVTSVVAQLEEESKAAAVLRAEREVEIDRMLADAASAAAGSPLHAANVERLRAATAVRRGAGATQAIARAPANAPLAAQARNAHIEAVGVYEAANGVHGVGVQRKAGSVQVRVRRSDKPVILVLSAYEPVNWMLTVETGANLQAVLVGGYHQGQVFGGGSARVVQLERGYAYKRGSGEYSALDAEVVRWTGKPIGAFQGRYDGSTFVTGL